MLTVSVARTLETPRFERQVPQVAFEGRLWTCCRSVPRKLQSCGGRAGKHGTEGGFLRFEFRLLGGPPFCSLTPPCRGSSEG